MKRKILYVSMCMPFDKAFHAGGKTFNYYINSFTNDERYEVTLVTKVLPEEEKMLPSINPQIRYLSVATPRNGIRKTWAYMKSLNSKFNPCYKYGNTLTKEIYDQMEQKFKMLKREDYYPDVVILEWTSMLLFIDTVKRYFPKACFIASEHDVSFLGRQRRYQNERRLIAKRIKKIAFDSLKKKELSAIDKCDLVVTHNEKDKQLLLKNGINATKLDVIVPYFDKFPSTSRRSTYRDIIYYGAMNRIENSTSAIWFINEVLPRLKDLAIRFIVIGNKPPKELLEYAGGNVIVTGFVDDPSEYFAEAMCLVAPLLLGAGIKVKIIEALSSGVPVLTNSIGIEGIDAVDKRDYFHCETPEEYEGVIRGIITRKIDDSTMSNNAINLINTSYDLEASYKNYAKRIDGLLGGEM